MYIIISEIQTIREVTSYLAVGIKVPRELPSFGIGQVFGFQMEMPIQDPIAAPWHCFHLGLICYKLFYKCCLLHLVFNFKFSLLIESFLS
jgi:hypothetical protein